MNRRSAEDGVLPGGDGAAHGPRMDGIYRHQRHVYDLTRKYYLLGRDRLIERLDVAAGGAAIEIGCGTGRNLVLVAGRYRNAALYGIDISSAMLSTAHASLARRGFAGRVTLARADAVAFDPAANAWPGKFERVFFSYTLSMIPDWKGALANAMEMLGPGGELHVVDFGQCEGLPGWFRRGLFGWLARFHVMPRRDLVNVLRDLAASRSLDVAFEPLYRGYAWYARVGRALER